MYRLGLTLGLTLGVIFANCIRLSLYLVLDQNVNLSVRFVRSNLKLTVRMLELVKMSDSPTQLSLRAVAERARVFNYGRREE